MDFTSKVKTKRDVDSSSLSAIVFLRGSHDNKDVACVLTPEEEQVDHPGGASGVKLAVVFFTTAQQLDHSEI